MPIQADANVDCRYYYRVALHPCWNWRRKPRRIVSLLRVDLLPRPSHLDPRRWYLVFEKVIASSTPFCDFDKSKQKKVRNCF